MLAQLEAFFCLPRFDFAPAFASLADANLWLEHQGDSNVNSDHAYDAGLEAAQKAQAEQVGQLVDLRGQVDTFGRPLVKKG